MAALSFAAPSLLPRPFHPSLPFHSTFPPRHGRPSLPRPLPRLSAVSAVHFEELVERDWSFLDSSPAAKKSHRISVFDVIIAAAGLSPDSRALACFPAAGFIDRIAEVCPCQLLIATHDSLFLLAEIKENHDSVRCWQGGVDAVPERFSPFDSAFVCYFPAMGVSIAELLRSLARRCSPGARVVIGCEHGRDGVKRHREEHPDVVTSDWPSKSDLEQATKENNFQIVELVDESSVYRAVLQLS
ncbi:uncharacterized protein LOC144709708 [Wolffia australiana]